AVEGDVLALAVHVHEQLAYLLEGRQVDHAAVDAGGGAPGGVYVAGQDDGVIGAVLGIGQPALDEDIAQGLAGGVVHGGEVEHALDAGRGGAVAHELRPDAGAEEGAEGVDNDGLARARLPGEGVEALPEAQEQVVYDGEVRYV